MAKSSNQKYYRISYYQRMLFIISLLCLNCFINVQGKFEQKNIKNIRVNDFQQNISKSEFRQLDSQSQLNSLKDHQITEKQQKVAQNQAILQQNKIEQQIGSKAQDYQKQIEFDKRFLQTIPMQQVSENSQITEQKNIDRLQNQEFSDIQLQNEIPLTLLVNQIIEINGRVLNEISDTVTQGFPIFIIFQGESSSFRCFGAIKQDNQFDINCRILRVGQFKIMFQIGQFLSQSDRLRKVISSQGQLQQNQDQPEIQTNQIGQISISSQNPQQTIQREVTIQTINGILVQVTKLTTKTPSQTRVQTTRRVISNPTPSARQQVSNNQLMNQITQQEETADNSINFASESPSANNLKLLVQENFLYLRWQPSGKNSNAVIRIKQKQLIVQSNVMLNIGFYKFDPVDYRQFQQNVQVTLEFIINGSNKNPPALQFIALQHKFSQTRNSNNIRIQPIPYKIDLGETIIVQGTFLESMRNQIILQTPKSSFQSAKLVQNLGINAIVSPNTPIKTQITFNQQGAYLLQINRQSGRALINRPVYVGNGYPLLPDFADLAIWALNRRTPPLPYFEQYASRRLGQTFKEPPSSSSLQVKRKYLVDLNNALRVKYGRQPLIIDESLHRLSQMHTDDMVSNNFTGHINLRGQSPTDRARKLGIMRNVGQNLATAYSLTENFLNLWRSAAHFRNSLRQQWQTVGVGITKSPRNLVYVVYNFANRDIMKNSLNDQEIDQIREQLIEFTLEMNPQLESHDPRISETITQWMKNGENGNLFNLVADLGYRGLSETSWNLTYKPDLVQDFKNARGFPKNMPNFDRFGIGITTSGQQLQIRFIFAV